MSKNQKRHSTTEKRMYVKAFYDSGLSQSMFTRLNGIPNSTFQRWIKNPCLNNHFKDDTPITNTEALTAEPVTNSFARLGDDDDPTSIIEFTHSDDEKAVICNTESHGASRQGNPNPMMMHIGMPVRLTCGQIQIDVPMGARGKDLRCILEALKGIC